MYNYTIGLSDYKSKIFVIIVPMLNKRIASIGTIYLQQGITNTLISQLIHYSTDSTDTAIWNFTNDKKRFETRQAFEKWRKNRHIYTLVGSDNTLLAIVWFGKKEFPEGEYENDFQPEKYGFTLAIRIYGKARSKGLAIPFMHEALRNFEATEVYTASRQKNQHGIWLETNVKNTPATKTYEKFGFTHVARKSKEKKQKILMVYRPFVPREGVGPS